MSTENVKSVMAVLALLAIIVAFFCDKLQAEYVTGVFGLIIGHYFESQKTAIATKQVEEKNAEIQSLKASTQDTLAKSLEDKNAEIQSLKSNILLAKYSK